MYPLPFVTATSCISYHLYPLSVVSTTSCIGYQLYPPPVVSATSRIHYQLYLLPIVSGIPAVIATSCIRYQLYPLPSCIRYQLYPLPVVSGPLPVLSATSCIGCQLKQKCPHSPLNLRSLSSKSVPFTFTTVQVPNLALAHTKRITVQLKPVDIFYGILWTKSLRRTHIITMFYHNE